MDKNTWMNQQFEEHRSRLRSIAYRMLGSLSEADDAVQEAWLRVNRADTDDVDNPGGWLTTVTARVCLNMLRSRRSRAEEPLDAHVPDPVIDRYEQADPEHQALLADSVGLALLAVIELLDPAERLAFVLHDMFAVPFDQIATILDRSPEATRQLASRARRRVQGAAPAPDVALPRQREIVDAFFAAARGGDFEALVAVLDPQVVLRSDGGASNPAVSASIRGAAEVARRALMFARPAATLHPAVINGAAGVVITADGGVFGIIGFTVRGGRIVAIDALADPDRLSRLDASKVLG